MVTFREFLENEDKSEEEKNIRDTLNKLPPSHQSLVKGYSFKFSSGNTLKGDDQHIGYMDKGPKEIEVAAPWNYGREFTFLHEIAHRVWEKLPDQIKHHWSKIAKASSPHEQEENFCMAYAAAYCDVPPAKHYHKEWLKFISELPK